VKDGVVSDNEKSLTNMFRKELGMIYFPFWGAVILS